MLYDAHNHFQDARLDSDRASILMALRELGISEAVVNGSAEDDWEDVARLAGVHDWLMPSFGLHPWYVKERTPAWQERLRGYLLAFPNAAVGEIGLDRWIENPDIEAQISCFRWQVELATELNRPATIHCLRAWGLLEEQLRTLALPKRGFLLHSYGGPPEMIPSFVKMGAYFSLSPYFGHARKAQQLAALAAVPMDRLLAETDAPDIPPHWLYVTAEARAQGVAQGRNTPDQIPRIAQELADLRGVSLDTVRLATCANVCSVLAIKTPRA